MIQLISIVIYLGIVFLIYRGILKKQDDTSLGKKAYLRTLLMGAIPCTIAIMILELTFDRFFPQPDGNSLAYELMTSFFRAALIEEGVKMAFARSAIKRHVPASKLEYMLLAGMTGLGYGLSEKLAIGGGAALIVNAVLPLHVFFQFFMGAYLYEAAKASSAGDDALKKKSMVLAFAVPFAFHGLWDALLGTAGWLMDAGSGADTIGVLVMFALIIAGLIAEIRIVRKMAKMK